MSEGLIVGDLQPQGPGEFNPGCAQGLVEDLFSRAQDNEDCSHLKNGIQGFTEDIKPLLACQSGDHADYRGLYFHLVQAENAEQVLSALLFPVQVGRVKRPGDKFVGSGVPIGVIHSVEDAEETVTALPKEAVETMAELRRLDL